MTLHQSPTAGTGDSLTSAPDAHAFVQNGELFLMTGGHFRKSDRWDALFTLLQLEGSPYPSSQERARQIRAVLKQSQKETYNGHAH